MRRKPGGTTYFVLLLKELQVGDFVTPQIPNDVFAPEQVRELARAVLVLLQLGEHLLSLVYELGGRVLEAVDLAVQVDHKNQQKKQQQQHKKNQKKHTHRQDVRD